MTRSQSENRFNKFIHRPVVLIHHHHLHVTWYETWQSSIFHALNCLPEMDTCPHDLYRLLMQNTDSARKRVAVVANDAEVVAVAGLRQTGRTCWVPITQWITCGGVIPALPEYMLPSLDALNTEVCIAWWRMADKPPMIRSIRNVESVSTYRFHLDEDYESYWGESGHWNTVRRCRNRCSKFRLGVNRRDSAEWTIGNWWMQWRSDSGCKESDLSDRIIAAKFLENQGVHYSFNLFDQDKPVAGHTFLSHHNDLVWQVSYRDPAYDWYGVGTGLMDLIFAWGKQEGYSTIDLGGWHDYKLRWAPQEGEHLCFNICPGYLYRLKQARNWVKDIRNNIIHHN